MKITIPFAIVFAALSLAGTAQAQVVANSVRGWSDFGIASQPIANVTATDTINGAPVTLGSGGNGILSKYNTWQSGLGLNPTTGAVSTGASLPVGTYTVQYSLCEQSAPSVCNQGTITINVLSGVITTVPESGSAASGSAIICWIIFSAIGFTAGPQ